MKNVYEQTIILGDNPYGIPKGYRPTRKAQLFARAWLFMWAVRMRVITFGKLFNIGLWCNRIEYIDTDTKEKKVAYLVN